MIRDWGDRPLAIVGTGPSLAGFDFERLHDPRWRVLAVKQAHHFAPWAHACFGLDQYWAQRDRALLADLAKRMAVYVALAEDEIAGHGGPIPGVRYLGKRRHPLLSDDPTAIQSGGNSGYGAFNLAYLKGAIDVALFGFDYSADGGHFCPDRYAHNPIGHNARYFTRWAACYDDAIPQVQARGMSIFNASPRSTLAAFPKGTIDEGLAFLKSKSFNLDRV